MPPCTRQIKAKADEESSVAESFDNSPSDNAADGPPVSLANTKMQEAFPKLQTEKFASALKYIQMGWGAKTPIDNFTVSLSTGRLTDKGDKKCRSVIMKHTIPSPMDSQHVSLCPFPSKLL